MSIVNLPKTYKSIKPCCGGFSYYRTSKIFEKLEDAQKFVEAQKVDDGSK
jgi:hypothetical protein